MNEPRVCTATAWITSTAFSPLSAHLKWTATRFHLSCFRSNTPPERLQPYSQYIYCLFQHNSIATGCFGLNNSCTHGDCLNLQFAMRCLHATRLTSSRQLRANLRALPKVHSNHASVRPSYHRAVICRTSVHAPLGLGTTLPSCLALCNSSDRDQSITRTNAHV
jgi:hypothetical protein